jgi:hypothetical protein
VNDRVADRPFSVVWCPLANSGTAFDGSVGGRDLRFEPSGVLMHGSIVVQDRETGSFWPLLQGQALYGPLEGTRLKRIPGVVKARFAEWVREHPDTLVWSLHGQEHLGRNPMMKYLSSSLGYDGMVAEDRRLPTKEPVFGFFVDGRPHAVAARDAAGGRVFRLPGTQVLVYRSAASPLQETTRAYVSTRGFRPEGGGFVEVGQGGRFDPARGRFLGEAAPQAIEGFDTFWYVWSLNYPETTLLGR